MRNSKEPRQLRCDEGQERRARSRAKQTSTETSSPSWQLVAKSAEDTALALAKLSEIAVASKLRSEERVVSSLGKRKD